MRERRFNLAIIFFLLAGRDNLKQIINVAVKNLDDPFLALWVCRVLEGETGICLLPHLRLIASISNR